MIHVIQQRQRHGPVNKKTFRASTISASPYITWPKLDRHRLYTEPWRESLDSTHMVEVGLSLLQIYVA